MGNQTQIGVAFRRGLFDHGHTSLAERVVTQPRFYQVRKSIGKTWNAKKTSSSNLNEGKKVEKKTSWQNKEAKVGIFAVIPIVVDANSKKKLLLVSNYFFHF